MKKILSILLVMALLLCGAYFAYAIAEAPDAAPDAPVVDLTRVIVSVLVLVFEFLLAWIAKVIVPPLREWLGVNTTERQRKLLWDAITSLVEAAEQTITGPGQGKQRLEYVIAGLMERGFAVDRDMIEAAVKQMNDKLALTMGEAFDIPERMTITPIPMNADGTPDLEITHWNTEQLKTFCELNNIPADGCATKEDYMAAIERGALDGESCAVKDYCDLDDGNPVQEEPQSKVE